MKIKQRPEDFEVEELTDVRPGSIGPFALYRMEKRGWSTHDALAAVRRRWKIDARRLAYGGLKDRHAHTVQYFSIFRGPHRKLSHHQVEVEYLGQLPRAYSSKDIRANRFALTVRDLNEAEVMASRTTVVDVARAGLPNYFDDQRFGSVSAGSHDFMARAWVLDQYEDALKLALAAPYEFDRAEEKREKQILRECWGDWPRCKERLGKGHARCLVTYLVDHPTDYRGTLRRLRPVLASLYLSA
ncbi:MAG: tRNA pseudouridine(13) synthase TruD, partial [Gemmataceae bacterium]